MKTVKQVINEIIKLSHKAMKTSSLWQAVSHRCEVYLNLMGVKPIDKLKVELNVALQDIKDAHLDLYVRSFQALLDELNWCEYLDKSPRD